MGFLDRLRNRERYLDQIQATKRKASEIAEKATVGNHVEVVVTLTKRASDQLVGSLEEAMEDRGYKFAGWNSGTQAKFVFAAEEIERERKLREETLYADNARVISDVNRLRYPVESEGEVWVTLTKDRLAFGFDGASSIPLNQVSGFTISQAAAIGPSVGTLIVRGGFNDAPPPTAFIFYPTEVEQFRDAMKEAGIREIEEPLVVRGFRSGS